MNTIINGSASEADAARKQLREELLAIAPVFGQKPYFLSDEFSLVDCYLAPLLWRLPQLASSSAARVRERAERLYDPRL